MMKALYLAPTYPLPLRAGGDIRTWMIAKSLSQILDVTMLCRSPRAIREEEIRSIQEENFRVVPIHVPRPGRKEKIIKGLASLLKGYPLMVAGMTFPEIKSRLRGFLSEEKFTILTVESSWMGAYLPIVSDHPTLKVLSIPNIEAEYLRRQTKILPVGFEKVLYYYDAFRMQKFEEDTMRQFHLILVPSFREKEILKRQGVNVRVEIIPNGVDSVAHQQLPLPYNQTLLFVGSMRYPPNLDAINFFISEILPIVRKRIPGLTLRVVGRDIRGPLTRRIEHEGVQVLGEVESMQEAYRGVQMAVVPIRSGSGTRVKILEALAYGRPVVSTSIGCEGLEVEEGRHILIADQPEEFAAKIIQVLKNERLAGDLADHGRQLVEEKYSWEKVSAEVIRVYRQLLSREIPVPEQKRGGICQSA